MSLYPFHTMPCRVLLNTSTMRPLAHRPRRGKQKTRLHTRTQQRNEKKERKKGRQRQTWINMKYIIMIWMIHGFIMMMLTVYLLSCLHVLSLPVVPCAHRPGMQRRWFRRLAPTLHLQEPQQQQKRRTGRRKKDKKGKCGAFRYQKGNRAWGAWRLGQVLGQARRVTSASPSPFITLTLHLYFSPSPFITPRPSSP